MYFLIAEKINFQSWKTISKAMSKKKGKKHRKERTRNKRNLKKRKERKRTREKERKNRNKEKNIEKEWIKCRKEGRGKERGNTGKKERRKTKRENLQLFNQSPNLGVSKIIFLKLGCFHSIVNFSYKIKKMKGIYKEHMKLHTAIPELTLQPNLQHKPLIILQLILDSSDKSLSHFWCKPKEWLCLRLKMLQRSRARGMPVEFQSTIPWLLEHLTVSKEPIILSVNCVRITNYLKTSEVWTDNQVTNCIFNASYKKCGKVLNIAGHTCVHGMVPWVIQAGIPHMRALFTWLLCNEYIFFKDFLSMICTKLFTLRYKTTDKVNRKWEDDGRILLSRNSCQCLKVAKLKSLWIFSNDVSSFFERTRCIHFTICCNDLDDNKRKFWVLCFCSF